MFAAEQHDVCIGGKFWSRLGEDVAGVELALRDKRGESKISETSVGTSIFSASLPLRSRLRAYP